MSVMHVTACRSETLLNHSGHVIPARRLDIGSLALTGASSPIPRLSIAIPTFQRFDLLQESLASVFQRPFGVSFEVLVVDNDPDGDTQAIKAMRHFADHALSYYKNDSNIGMVQNWNRCLELARGDYVTLLHDDDLFGVCFAQAVSHWLSRNGPLAPAMAWRHGVLDQRHNRPPAPPPAVPGRLRSGLLSLRGPVRWISTADLFFGNPFAGTLGIVLERRRALALGGFDPSWHPISDYEFWCRWTEVNGSIGLVRTERTLYRKRENESILPQTRRAFCKRSRDLRERMLANNALPGFLHLLIEPLEQIQRRGLEVDWHTIDQPEPVRPSALRKWAWFVFSAVLVRLAHLMQRLPAAKNKPS